MTVKVTVNLMDDVFPINVNGLLLTLLCMITNLIIVIISMIVCFSDLNRE